MASETEIANFALSHLGIGKDISNIDTERSQEALACKRFYATTRDAVLRDFHWPFAKKVRTLSLVEEDPTDEWAFSYQYPSDCIMLRRMLSGTRMDTNDTDIPYEIANGAAGKVIYTDLEDAQMEYTKRETDPTVYSADFMMALSWRLAAYIAPRITGSDQFKLAPIATQMYLGEISRAQANALNEERNDPTPDAEFIRSRS